MKLYNPELNQGESISIAIYGLKAIKPKQTLVQPTGNCKELNSYSYKFVVDFYTFEVG